MKKSYYALFLAYLGLLDMFIMYFQEYSLSIKVSRFSYSAYSEETRFIEALINGDIEGGGKTGFILSIFATIVLSALLIYIHKANKNESPVGGGFCAWCIIAGILFFIIGICFISAWNGQDISASSSLYSTTATSSYMIIACGIGGIWSSILCIFAGIVSQKKNNN